MATKRNQSQQITVFCGSWNNQVYKAKHLKEHSFAASQLLQIHGEILAPCGSELQASHVEAVNFQVFLME